jgi:hypothetical protein
MSQLGDFIQDAKSKRLVITGNNGKFTLSFTVFVAIILGVILPQIAVIITLAVLTGYLSAEIQPINNVTTL